MHVKIVIRCTGKKIFYQAATDSEKFSLKTKLLERLRHDQFVDKHFMRTFEGAMLQFGNNIYNYRKVTPSSIVSILQLAYKNPKIPSNQVYNYTERSLTSAIKGPGINFKLIPVQDQNLF